MTCCMAGEGSVLTHPVSLSAPSPPASYIPGSSAGLTVVTAKGKASWPNQESTGVSSLRPHIKCR